ncbi:hypothetical protein B7494_g699 [Chlorociboria aeruginascens]|nr:hypothetical protein B7494_g699 [Chlorociboria aeruginascens]
MIYPVLLAAVFAVLSVSAFLVIEYFKPIDTKLSITGSKWKLPPGPKGSFLVGSLNEFFHARKSGQLVPWLLSFRKYGEMSTVHMGSRTWVFLNSDRVVSEIIAKRSKITSQRPTMPVASGLVSNKKRTVIRQTDEWMEGRRVMHHLLNGHALKQYGEWQDLESLQLLLSYLRKPEMWYSHHFRYTTGVIYRLVMGERLAKTKLELDDYQQVTMEFIFSINGSFVDFFPKVTDLPIFLQFWRQGWAKMGAFHRRIFSEWWRPIQQSVEHGTAGPSFVRDVLLHPDVRYKGDDEEAMYLATSIMAAGGDNPRMTLNTFVMASICFPEVIKRARAEVDSICGNPLRLPLVADMMDMPYVCAMIKEILRWRPTVPIVPQHELTEDLEFEGYFFPKGTNFLINAEGVASHHDTPDEFRPERWLDGNETNVLHNLWAFGGGRRVCVGYKVAQQILFVSFARLIQCFDYTPNGPIDSRKLNPNTLKEPFKVKISVRGPEYAELIETQAMKEGLKVYVLFETDLCRETHGGRSLEGWGLIQDKAYSLHRRVKFATLSKLVRTLNMASTKEQEQLIPHVIDEIARTEPDATWLEFPKVTGTYESGFEAITFAQFANAINGIAHLLEKALGKSETVQPLAYLAPNDARCAITLVGAIKAGYASFLTSDRNSVAAHLSLFDDLNCTTIVTTDPPVIAVEAILAERSMKVMHIPSLRELLSNNYPDYPYDKDFAASQDDIAFICHTSGSTGFPKPRLYKHEFISMTNRMIKLDPPDGFEMLSTMMSRKRTGIQLGMLNSVFNRTITILPLPGVPPTGETLAEMLKHTKANWAATAPLTLEGVTKNLELMESIVRPLEMLLYSGGSLPKVFGDIIASKIKLVTMLGSSETGAFPTMYRTGFDFKNDWNYLQVHPAFGAKFEIQRDHVYELVLHRSAHPQAIQTAFTHFPELKEYRTKDLFTPHSQFTDLWTHASRSDDLIVFLNSEKMNPVGFESQVSRNPEVSAVLMFGSQRFEAGLLIELADQTIVSMVDCARALERLWPTIEKANSVSPQYAQVSKSHVCFTDPDKPFLRTAKGTIRRKAILDLYAAKINQVYTDIEEAWAAEGAEITQDWSDLELLKQLILESIHDTSKLSGIDGTTDFFTRGMDSLGVLRLVRRLKAKTGIQGVSPSMVYLKSTVVSLAQALKDTFQSLQTSEKDKMGQRKEEIGAVLDTLNKEIDELAMTIPSSTTTNDHVNSERNQHVLLTGSTGTIGSYVLAALLKDPRVSHVYCLNRSADSDVLQRDRNAKVDTILPMTFPEDQVTFLTVDLSNRENLSLSTTAYDNLSKNVTLIIHNAWPVDFNLPLTSFRAALAGVVALISLSAKSSLKPAILFLSSISSAMNLPFLDPSITAVPESIITDLAAPASGYGESKYIAERLLAYAAEKLRIRTMISRTGQVAGAAHSFGLWNSAEWVPSLILSSRYLRVIPNTLTSSTDKNKQDIDWLPVDILGNVLLDFGFDSTESLEPPVHVYQPINPNRTSWNKMLPYIIEALNNYGVDGPVAEKGPIRIVTPQEWLKKLRTSAASLDDTSTSPDALVLANPALKLVEFFEAQFSGHTGPNIEWESAKAEKASGSLREAVAVDEKLISRWVKAWCSTVA